MFSVLFIKNCFKKLIVYHVGVLAYFLDPLVFPQTRPYQYINSKWQNVNFFLPVFYLVAIIFLYGNLSMIFQYTIASNGSFLNRPKHSQLLYYPAALFPLQVWPQSEVVSLIAFGTAISVLLTFVGRSTLFTTASRYEVQMFRSQQVRLIINGKSGN